MKARSVTFRMLFSLLMLCSIPVAQADLTQTIWTGAVNNLWSDSGNWSNGVPTLDHQAVFDGNSAQLDIILPGGGTVPAGAFLFLDNGGQDIVLRNPEGNNDHWAGLPNGFTFEIGSGVGSVTLDLNNGRLAALSGSYHFTNNGEGVLSIPRYNRDGAGAPNWRFDGSGDFLLAGGAAEASGSTHLETTFTGTLHVPAGRDWHSNAGMYINGGTLLVDGSVRNRMPDFINNGGIITGNGRLGATTSANNVSTLTFQMNRGAIIDPGRVGETGALTFENHNLFLNDGSILRLDLRSVLDEDYDRLLFVYAPHSNATERDLERMVHPSVIIAEEGEVLLQLNLLDGFAANVGDEFVILSGYDNISGTFSGLSDGTVLTVGEYQFQIHYGEEQTMLTVIPEPGAAAWLIGVVLAALVACRLRGTYLIRK